MPGKIRWGILSTARVNRSLLEPLQQSPRSELVAVASRSREKAEAYAQEKDIPTAYGSYEALLADPNIDAIYNPLPNSLHCEWTVKAAEAGKHVLCEKPLVLTLAELDQVEMATQANQVVVFEALAHLHHPQTRHIQTMLAAGELGELQLMSGWSSYYLPPEHSQNIRLYPELGGGSFWDVGVYPNSLAIILNGGVAPETVWAGQITAENGVEVALTGQLNFANGVVAQLSSGFRTPWRQGFQIVGSEGMLEVSRPNTPYSTRHNVLQMQLTRRDNQEETITIPAYNAYLAEVEAMEACILDGAEPIISLNQSREFLRTVLALYESAETGELVDI